MNIPDELAKRVLEALTVGGLDALVGSQICDSIERRDPMPCANLIAIGLRHDAMQMNAARDELAALLTPKEAT